MKKNEKPNKIQTKSMETYSCHVTFDRKCNLKFDRLNKLNTTTSK